MTDTRGVTTDPGTDWRTRAACLDEDPELFFPIGTTGTALAQIAEAKAVCARCPVAAQCLAFAIDTGQQYGVWAGLDQHVRAKRTRSLRAWPTKVQHGTWQGYDAHRRRKQDPCEACRAAHSAYRMANKKRGRVTS